MGLDGQGITPQGGRPPLASLSSMRSAVARDLIGVKPRAAGRLRSRWTEVRHIGQGTRSARTRMARQLVLQPDGATGPFFDDRGSRRHGA